MKTGRNDPCPCGSGKKYKQCCLKTEAEPAADDLAWRRVRRAIDPLAKMLTREAADRFGEAGFREAREEFFFLEDDEDGDSETEAFTPLFFTYFLFDWLPDPHHTQLPATTLHELTAAQSLLRRSRHLDPIARRYLEACCATAMSFYDVLEVLPGTGFRARDMVLENELDVVDKAASRFLKPGDTIFGRIVPIDGLHLVESMGSIAIPPRHKPEIIDGLRKVLPHGRSTIDVQREYDHEMREIYLTLAEHLMNPQMRELRNTDGDPIEAHTLNFDLDAPEAAAKALSELGAGIIEPQLNYDENGAFVSAEITWSRAGKPTRGAWDNTALGFIRIVGNRLTGDVNSQRRAAALRRSIEKILGASAHARPTVIQSAQSMLREANRDAGDADGLEITPELAAAFTEHMRTYYRNWVDEKIPVLGGKTPRQAIRTKHGRQSVAALIDQLERDGEFMNPPLDPTIVGELRQTLQIDID